MEVGFYDWNIWMKILIFITNKALLMNVVDLDYIHWLGYTYWSGLYTVAQATVTHRPTLYMQTQYSMTWVVSADQSEINWPG